MSKDSNLFTKKDYRYFEMARQQAEKSDYKNIHMGCVIVYKNHVIGAGHNDEKTSPQQKKANNHRDFNYNSRKPVKHCIHAEIAALKNIPYTVFQSVCWRDVKVYVFRIAPGKPLHQGLARPCNGCMTELKELGVKNFYYSTDDGYGYEESF